MMKVMERLGSHLRDFLDRSGGIMGLRNQRHQNGSHRCNLLLMI